MPGSKQLEPGSFFVYPTGIGISSRAKAHAVRLRPPVDPSVSKDTNPCVEPTLSQPKADDSTIIHARSDGRLRYSHEEEKSLLA